MIVAQVRRRPHCQGFKSIVIYPLDDRSVPFNWSTGPRDYGEAGPDSCEAALGEIISLLQAQYDLAE
jgi:hypothetical protein